MHMFPLWKDIYAVAQIFRPRRRIRLNDYSSFKTNGYELNGISGYSN
jgi:hypothetical protein